MNKQAMWAIAKKDMAAIRSNVQVWLPMAIVPLLLGVLFPTLFTALIAYAGIENKEIQEMAGWVTRLPLGPVQAAVAALPSLNQQLAYLVANYMLAPFFVLIPLMTASVIGADSFAGEKERGTLETLLFAPVDLISLFLGKLLASLIPSVLLTLGTFILCGITVNAVGWKLFGRIFFPEWNWLPMLVLVIPLISVAAILINVFISAKVASFQAAYQLGALFVLPFILLLVGQLSGVLMLGTGLVLILAAVLAVIDLVMLQVLLRRLDRSALFESQVR
ncbi:MAG TPA: ABC transporter permease subunit [Symbiobacteriaceae bacterium]|nr:ABC transporter permease subunit [Symbiobacteriaceae bacterium]